MRIPEADLRRAFHVGLWLKAAHSLLEVLSGLALVFVTHERIIGMAMALTRAELLEDPQDLMANTLRQAAEGFTTEAQSFAAWYLVSHGAIKLALVAGVLANRIWAYPAFIAMLIGFILYQLYRIGAQFSVFLVALTILDLVVLVLAVHEYRFVRRDRRRSGVDG